MPSDAARPRSAVVRSSLPAITGLLFDFCMEGLLDVWLDLLPSLFPDELPPVIIISLRLSKSWGVLGALGEISRAFDFDRVVLMEALRVLSKFRAMFLGLNPSTTLLVGKTPPLTVCT